MGKLQREKSLKGENKKLSKLTEIVEHHHHLRAIVHDVVGGRQRHRTVRCRRNFEVLGAAAEQQGGGQGKQQDSHLDGKSGVSCSLRDAGLVARTRFYTRRSGRNDGAESTGSSTIA